MLRTMVLALLVMFATPPADRLSYMRAVTEPLFRCDTASAPLQLSLCPGMAQQIARTRIPHHFHGHVYTLAKELRSTSSHCAWIIRTGALHFLRTSDSIYPPATGCESQVAQLVTSFYAARQ